MAWLPREQMSDIHVIRQDYAKARAISDADPTLENLEVTSEMSNRRYRAIRSLHDDGDMTVRQIAAMFRCSKATVRECLAVEEDQA